MPSPPGAASDASSCSAREDIRYASNLIDGRLRIAGRNQDFHRRASNRGWFLVFYETDNDHTHRDQPSVDINPLSMSSINRSPSHDSGEVAVPALTERYVLESPMGWLVKVTAEAGEHLPIWLTRQTAESVIPTLAGGGGYQVAVLSAKELHDELSAMRDDGMRFVLIEPSLQNPGFLLPIDEAMNVYDLMTKPLSGTEGGEDHFIQRLDQVRAGSMESDPDADTIPVDCPVCHGYVTLPEQMYRAWRGGRLEAIQCPKCTSWFREAEFERIRCSDCGCESGWMPPSFSQAFRRGEHPWRCLTCGEAARNRIAQARSRPSTFWGEINWYSVIVGGAALVALLAGLYVKFILMAD